MISLTKYLRFHDFKNLRKRKSYQMFSNYNPINHSLLSSLISFQNSETKQLAHAIKVEDKNEIILINPMKEFIMNYFTLMDDQDLKIRSILLTKKNIEFKRFYEEIQDFKEAFSKNFTIYYSSNTSNSNFF